MSNGRYFPFGKIKSYSYIQRTTGLKKNFSHTKRANTNAMSTVKPVFINKRATRRTRVIHDHYCNKFSYFESFQTFFNCSFVLDVFKFFIPDIWRTHWINIKNLNVFSSYKFAVHANFEKETVLGIGINTKYEIRYFGKVWKRGVSGCGIYRT